MGHLSCKGNERWKKMIFLHKRAFPSAAALKLGRAITAKKNKKPEVPFTCGVYEASGRKFLLNHSIKKDEIVIDKFHYYKIGETTAPGITACIFWTSRSWNANVSLGSFARAGLDTNDQKYEVWAEMKFEGKGHSPQSKSDADNIWIGEVVIIRK